MKTYQKFTLITVILGLIIPLLGLFIYFFVNSIIGIPILGLFLGGALLIGILIIAINVAGLVVAFKIKNTKIVGIALIGCGAALFLAVQFLAIPGLILFVIAGILALKEKNPSYNLKERNPKYDSTQEDGVVCLNCQSMNLKNSIFCNKCGQKI